MTGEPKGGIPEDDWRDIIKSHSQPKTSVIQNLQARNECNDLYRTDAFQGAAHCWKVWLLHAFGVCALLVVFVRVLHYLMPTCLCWLDESQIRDMDKSLFGGVSGIIVYRSMTTALRAGDPSRGDS